jgi:hypothetical protein
MKIAAVFVLAYLALGAVAGDWWLHGHLTAPYQRQLMIGSAVLAGLFIIALWATRGRHRFIGFSHWQWRILPPLALAVGVALRVYAR